MNVVGWDVGVGNNSAKGVVKLPKYIKDIVRKADSKNCPITI